ncbi:hypothetical protein BKM63_13285 [Flavobacterium johnsoniae]|uniref:Uncharacterized protein n=1 Tax=Flavobacterium johnsoniae TaxID=986 RepID=A0A1J7BS32_FLAJO|nr:hypothetical protein BKM63_13285 [Flavobacterium johnsoniae]
MAHGFYGFVFAKARILHGFFEKSVILSEVGGHASSSIENKANLYVASTSLSLTNFAELIVMSIVFFMSS